MNNKVYLFLSCFLMFHVVSASKACSCTPNLKEEACTSDYVITAEVLQERQLMSQKGWVFHYSLNVTKVLKTSAAYEGSEKVMQISLQGNDCGGQLNTGHAYVFAGHVGEYVDEGVSRAFLETEYCNYVDFEDLAQNTELFKEIVEMIENPPACLQTRAKVQKLSKFNDPMRALGNFRKRGRWNHPFQK